MPDTATYGWIITIDKISLGADVGLTGPHNLSDDILERLQKGEGHAYRVRDDDDEVYHHGRFIGDPNSYDAFGPLNDFGRPGFGATDIQYFEDGKWVTL